DYYCCSSGSGVTLLF
nr:immunoglobulin light chain junction region [Macaca mulatta]